MPRKKSDYTQRMRELNEDNSYHSSLQNRTRARSVTIGAAGGGIIEIGMRGDFGSLWMPLHPVEIVEHIEQLAASAGLEIAIRPKQNFSAWRNWETPETELSRFHKGLPDWELAHQHHMSEMQKIELQIQSDMKKKMLMLEADHKVKQFSGQLEEAKQLAPAKPKRNRRKKVEEVLIDQENESGTNEDG